MEVGMWLGLVTVVWFRCFSGNNYTFSYYSVVLKNLMNLMQLQLNYLSIAKDISNDFGPLAGLAFDRIPTPSSSLSDFLRASSVTTPRDNLGKFLLMLVVTPVVICAMAMFFLCEAPPSSDGTTLVKEETLVKLLESNSNDDALLAFQIAFNLLENESQVFLLKVKNLLHDSKSLAHYGTTKQSSEANDHGSAAPSSENGNAGTNDTNPTEEAGDV